MTPGYDPVTHPGPRIPVPGSLAAAGRVLGPFTATQLVALTVAATGLVLAVPAGTGGLALGLPVVALGGAGALVNPGGREAHQWCAAMLGYRHRRRQCAQRQSARRQGDIAPRGPGAARTRFRSRPLERRGAPAAENAAAARGIRAPDPGRVDDAGPPRRGERPARHRAHSRPHGGRADLVRLTAAACGAAGVGVVVTVLLLGAGPRQGTTAHPEQLRSPVTAPGLLAPVPGSPVPGAAGTGVGGATSGGPGSGAQLAALLATWAHLLAGLATTAPLPPPGLAVTSPSPAATHSPGTAPRSPTPAGSLTPVGTPAPAPVSSAARP